jgi:predicted RNA-binding protein Jag
MSNMDWKEVEAASVEEATREALEQLGAREDEVTIEVIATPRAGVLGLGARQARVRVTRKGAAGAGTNPPASSDVGQASQAPRARNEGGQEGRAMTAARGAKVHRRQAPTMTAARPGARARMSRSSAARRWLSSSRFSSRWASRRKCGK